MIKANDKRLIRFASPLACSARTLLEADSIRESPLARSPLRREGTCCSLPIYLQRCVCFHEPMTACRQAALRVINPALTRKTFMQFKHAARGITGITVMDIIVVQFDTLRRVCIEGRDAGFTRQKIVIRRDADVRVSLAGPLDYSQPHDQVIATGGKWNLPRQIYFQGASK